MAKLRVKWHGLPVWAWLTILAAFIAFVVWRRRQTAAAQPDPNAVEDGGTLAGVPSLGLQDPSIDQPQYGRDAIPPPPPPSVTQTFNFGDKRKLPPGEGNKGGKGGKKRFPGGAQHWVRDDQAGTQGGHGHGRGRSGGGAAPFVNMGGPDLPIPAKGVGKSSLPAPAGWHPATGPVPHVGFDAAHATAGGASHSAMQTATAGGPPDRPHPAMAHAVVPPGQARVIGGPAPNIVGPSIFPTPTHPAQPLVPFPSGPRGAVRGPGRDPGKGGGRAASSTKRFRPTTAPKVVGNKRKKVAIR